MTDNNPKKQGDEELPPVFAGKLCQDNSQAEEDEQEDERLRLLLVADDMSPWLTTYPGVNPLIELSQHLVTFPVDRR